MLGACLHPDYYGVLKPLHLHTSSVRTLQLCVKSSQISHLSMRRKPYAGLVPRKQHVKYCAVLHIQEHKRLPRQCPDAQPITWFGISLGQSYLCLAKENPGRSQTCGSTHSCRCWQLWQVEAPSPATIALLNASLNPQHLYTCGSAYSCK